MTTNNEVKAKRPCTLWGKTFDSNDFVDIIINKQQQGNVPEDGGFFFDVEVRCIGGKNPYRITGYRDTYNEALLDAQKLTSEAIQAIASSQRPWLNAEGFEFGESIPYYFLRDSGTFEMLSIWNDEFHPCDSTGIPIDSDDCSEWWETEYRDNYTLSDFVAFKPIDDSQEAWDAVAHVEVWEGV